MTHGQLLWRMALGRRALALSLFLLAVAVSTLSTGTFLVHANVKHAVADAVEGHAAGRAYVLQPQNTATQDAVAKRTDVVPVWAIEAEARVDGAAVPVSMSYTEEALPLGNLISGRRPDTANESALSPAAVSALGADIGDSITLETASAGETSTTLVGVVADTSDRNRLMGFSIVQSEPTQLARWLTDTPYESLAQDPTLLERFNHRELLYRTVDILAADSVQAGTRTVRENLKFAWPAALAVSSFLTAVALWSLRRSGESTSGMLVDAGMPPRDAWKAILAVAGAAVLAGAVAGTGFAALLLLAFSDSFAGIFEQLWLTPAVPAVSVVSYLILFPLLAVAFCIGLAHIRPSVSARVQGRRALTAAIILTGAGLSVLLLVYFQAMPVVNATLAGVLLLVGASAWLVKGVGPADKDPHRKIAGNVRSVLSVASGMSAVTLFIAGLYVANLGSETNQLREQTVPQQPPGSLVLFEVGAQASEVVEAQFRRLGGETVTRMMIPVESSRTLRVSSPGVVECMRRDGIDLPDDILTECAPPQSLSPVNTVALTSAVGDRNILADPLLIHEGSVGLLDFELQSELVDRTGFSEAEPSGHLGGNLPGLLIPIDSALAQEYELIPSDSEYLVLHDFATLRPAAQATLRSLIAEVAGTAQLAEDYGFDDQGRTGVAVVVTLVSGVFSSLIWFSLLSGLLGSTHRLRQSLWALGASRSAMLFIGARIAVPVMVIHLLSLLAIWSCAWLQRGRVGDSGVHWALLFPGILVVLIWFVFRFARPTHSYGSGSG